MSRLQSLAPTSGATTTSDCRGAKLGKHIRPPGPVLSHASLSGVSSSAHLPDVAQGERFTTQPGQACGTAIRYIHGDYRRRSTGYGAYF
jgi:hypothetical protein